MEQVVIAQDATIKRLRGKQFAIERREIEDFCEFVVAEKFPKGAETQPQIGVIRPRGLHVEHPAQSRNAVMVAVDLIRADEAAIFRDEEEQKTVNDAKQLAVELRGGELLG
jgi:hypothetical protein